MDNVIVPLLLWLSPVITHFAHSYLFIIIMPGENKMSKFIYMVIPSGEKLSSFKTFIINTANRIKKNVTIAAINFIGYWIKPVADYVQTIKSNISASESKTKRLVVAALLSAIAAIMQTAGALGGPGFAVSNLVTLPITIAAILAIHTGIAAYITTCCLLLILQPSELIVFPFTTGLLGLGIGLAFRLLKKRIGVIALAAFSLTIGIAVLLYGLRFPVLGPFVSSDFQVTTIVLIYAFSFLYSWLWVEVSMINLKFLSKALVKSAP